MRPLNSSAGKPFKLTITERACSQVVASFGRSASFFADLTGFAGRSHAHFPVLPNPSRMDRMPRDLFAFLKALACWICCRFRATPLLAPLPQAE